MGEGVRGRDDPRLEDPTLTQDPETSGSWWGLGPYFVYNLFTLTYLPAYLPSCLSVHGPLRGFLPSESDTPGLTGPTGVSSKTVGMNVHVDEPVL